MTDASETVGSLDFGQQAMNVVVRAKVNASTDYGSYGGGSARGGGYGSSGFHYG